MKIKILAILLVASLMVGGMSCFGVSANEDINIQNEKTIKYIKSEENYDYGSDKYKIHYYPWNNTVSFWNNNSNRL